VWESAFIIIMPDWLIVSNGKMSDRWTARKEWSLRRAHNIGKCPFLISCDSSGSVY
jgi:hypothetical protein